LEVNIIAKENRRVLVWWGQEERMREGKQEKMEGREGETFKAAKI